MTGGVKYLAHKVVRTDRPNGTLMLQSGYELGAVVRNTGKWLEYWALEAPERTFLAERSGNGWRRISYEQTLQQVQAVSSGLLARGMNGRTPILILSGNGIDHGLLMLAGQYVGVPTVAVAEQYSLVEAAHDQLRHVVELVRPAMVFAADGNRFAPALSLDCMEKLEKVISTQGPVGATGFADLEKGGHSIDLQQAHGRVGPHTLAKILMTSGSTTRPKGVETTQRMLCANQKQIATVLPLLTARPPRILDWLPWNHTFGGSHNFNMMLANGGTLYIDDGKPIKGLFERSIQNLALAPGTISFNVPVGFAMLLDAFKLDSSLKSRFFDDLDMVFYAGASLPQDIWRGLEEMARQETGNVPMLTSSWGLTETAPASTLQYQPPESSGIIGVPLPGVRAKLVPLHDGRNEIRLKGPNVMKRYLGSPEATRQAFDSEGYFITGDSVRLVNDSDSAQGLRFEGRISEDFKLLTGTKVRASSLRLEALRALSPLVTDLVVTGHDRNEIGLLVFANREALAGQDIDVVDDGHVLTGDRLRQEIAARLESLGNIARTSSARICRVLVLSKPPSMPDGEATAKGNLNFSRILARRARLVDRLYNNGDTAPVLIGNKAMASRSSR